MAQENVTVGVRSDLSQISRDLAQLGQQANKVSDGLAVAGDNIEKGLAGNAKRIERTLEDTRSLGGRVADQLRGYFKDLLGSAAYSLQSVSRNLGLKNQLATAVRDSVQLNDTLRKLSTTLGLTGDRFASFQDQAVRAFASIGLGGDEAARALEGLAGTGVRDLDALMGYATEGGKLAVAGGEVGQIGDVTRLMAEVARARGVDPNDQASMKTLVDDVRRAMVVTGRGPAEVLEGMRDTFEKMADDLRRKVGTRGAAGLQAVESVVGPGFRALVEELTQGKLKRLPFEAQGGRGIIGPDGVNFEQLRKIIGIGRRIGFDKSASWSTALGNDQAAAAMVRLVEQIDRAEAAQRGVGRAGGSVDAMAKQNRGIVDTGKAIFNQAIAPIETGVVNPVIRKANEIMGDIAGSSAGSMAAVGLGALGAAGGAKLLSKFAGKKGGVGGLAEAGARAAIVEQITGQKTIPVYVVNVSEFGGAFGGALSSGPLGTKLPGALEKLGAAATALSVGLVIGQGVNAAMDKYTTVERKGLKGNAFEQELYSFGKILDSLGINDPLGLAEAARELRRNNEKTVESTRFMEEIAKRKRTAARTKPEESTSQ